MTLSNRLTRAGLAFLIFGTCAVMLPGNTGSFMTASDACTTGSHHTQTAAYVAGGAGAVFVIYSFLHPGWLGHGGGGGAGAGAPVFDPVTQLFQFIYDPGSSPTQ